ncbi:MAG: ABC transporter ATP-binding protein [Clostridia bacterium]|nr:ABC transporter ATP-binding protein [Clostridia bacterium]
MIKIDNLYKTFRTVGKTSCNALNGASLCINKSEMTAIIGASGAGKSTLLNVLSCIEKYESGTVEVDGVDLKSLNEEEAALYRNEKIGIVLQDFALITDFNVFENISLPLRFSKKRIRNGEIQKRVADISEKLGIKHLMKKRIPELSGGEKQRVAIARALVNYPEYIFADEPTGALDTYNTKMVVDLLKKISRDGIGVLIVTHDTAVSEACDKVFEMKDGIIVND